MRGSERKKQRLREAYLSPGHSHLHRCSYLSQNDPLNNPVRSICHFRMIFARNQMNR